MQRSSTPEPADFVLGDRYIVSGVLGRGAVGEVLAAHDTVLRRDVAVKVWRAVGTDPHALDRVAREARAAGLVEAPTVVTVLDADVRSQPPYLVMERLSGVTWADALRDAVPGDATSAAVLVDVLAALAAAHAVGVVHRDVKPANVLLTDDGRAKLADFGIASLVDGTRLTGTGDVLGSAPYLAPERLEGAGASGACDVWSVGVMAYEAFTGRRPYAADTPVLTAMAVLRGGHEPLRDVRPDLPEALLDGVEAALARDPSARPSPAGLRHVLEATLPPTDGLGDPMLAAFVAGAVPRGGAEGTASASPGATVLVPLPVAGPRTGDVAATTRTTTRTARLPARTAVLAAALLVVAGAGVAAGFGLDDDHVTSAASQATLPSATVPPASPVTTSSSSRASSRRAVPAVRRTTTTRVRTVVVRTTVTTTAAADRVRGPAPKQDRPGKGKKKGKGKDG